MMRERVFSSDRIWIACVRLLAYLTVVAGVAACGNSGVPLNSERIEARFGSYGVELLPAAPGLRRANLYSLEAGRPVCRTYAVVQWSVSPEVLPAELARAHREILAGASLGATLERAGWQVGKMPDYVGTLPALDPPPGWLRLMQVESTAGLAVTEYRLFVKKGSQQFDYATIIEVYHPDYLDPEGARELVPDSAGRGVRTSVPATVLALLADGD